MLLKSIAILANLCDVTLPDMPACLVCLEENGSIYLYSVCSFAATSAKSTNLLPWEYFCIMY